MSSKAIFVFCAQAVLVQSVLSQCIGRAAIDAFGAGPYGLSGFGLAAPGYGLSAFGYNGLAPRGLGYDGFYPALPALDFTPTRGGGLTVTSSSAVPPTGISIKSDNAYEGILAAAGELPFVGTTGMEGIVPSIGAGAINHGCGNGINAMTAYSDESSPASVATYGPAVPYGIPAPAIAPAIAAANVYGAPAYAAPGLAYDVLACDDGLEFTPTSGGALPVASGSSIPPTGIAVASESAYEGPLAVVGELPFVGTVGVEGILPTAGAGAVNHACGNGVNAMVSETSAFAPGYAGAAFGPAAYGPASAYGSRFGFPNGWAGRGCGCAY